MYPKGMPALAVVAIAAFAASGAAAEMLAITSFESKSPESLDALQLQASSDERREGVAIIELDPESPDYGRILIEIPVPSDVVLHHIFYNRATTKAYVTSLAKEVLHVIDLTRFPYRLQPIPTPGCQVQENIIFSDDDSTWFVSCMGSQNIAIGDGISDQMTRLVDIPGAYPHGMALDESIDRLVIANCVSPDLGAAGQTLEMVEASTGKYLGGIEIAAKPGAAPVETVYVPHSEPPIAMVTNMMEHSLWAAVWNPDTETFDANDVFDFKGATDTYMPLEIYFNRAVDRMYVTTAEPGHFHIFDISDGVLSPKLLASLPADGGAHHVAFTPDEKVAYVQNSLLNLPGLDAGTITVIDLEKMEVADTITTFRDAGLTLNSITMLPEWYHPAGHFNNGPVN